MPRLFTGIEVPPAIRTTLSFLQTGFKDVRWIEPSDFHITLRFIGDVSPAMGDDIVDALSGRSWVAPTIQLDELKCFGGSTPKSIYASIAANDALSSLAASQERLMQQLGLPADSRRFTPHITVARCKGKAANAVAHYLGEHAGYFTPPPYIPTRFVLYSARESTGGGPYRVEEVFPFKGR